MTALVRTIGEILEELGARDSGLRELAQRGKAGPSDSEGNLGGSRRVPKENSARKLGRGDPASGKKRP